MRQLKWAAIGLVCLAGGASAADLPPRAPALQPVPVVVPQAYNWTGFYIGVNGGYGWAGESETSGGVTVDVGKLKGPFVGGQIGFNYQTGMFVWGIEADGQWADITQTFPGFGWSQTITVDYFLTFRGRAGIAIQNVLLYGTGGFAYGGSKSSVTDGFTTLSQTDSRGGWTAGAGAEVGFGSFSTKLEYLYLQTFDKDQVFFGVPITTNTHVHTVKLGLNYRFGSH